MITFTIPGAPRTKKNGRERFMQGNKKLDLPSAAYMTWLNRARSYMIQIMMRLRREHPELRFPLARPVGVKAIFYCDNRTQGDWCGYVQGIDDLLGDKYAAMRVLVDDKWVKNHDGTRLRKDAANPRVEVTIIFPDDEPYESSANTEAR